MLSHEELFESLDLELPELSRVKAAVATGDLEAAVKHLGQHIRGRKTPDWLVPATDRPQPTQSPEAFEEAVKLIDHEFTFGFHGAPSFTTKMEGKIDWVANPSEGEYRTHLWNESLNRHFHFAKLVDAYWETGDDRFTDALVRDWLDWIENNPRPEDSGNKVEWPYGCYAWQTLTTAIRLERSWPVALYKCIDRPAFSDVALCAIAGSYCDQARHLLAWPTGHNWLTEECMGLYTAGVLFPEFKEAAGWRKTAIERLHLQLTDEVYPDGAEYELAGGYGMWVVRNMVMLMEHAEMVGRSDEIPDDFKALTEKTFDYLMSVAMPNGEMPGLNDSGNRDVTSLLETGFELYPQRTDFQYVASRGETGDLPSFTSRGLPWSGHYVMRTGWGVDDAFMLVDSGPYGSAHQHEDKLHFVLYAHGKQLVLDPGNYSYDASRWRKYVLTTPGHNTVMVDGMGQYRRGDRDTYYWPRPWEGDAPAENDTLWVTGPDFDFVRGTYREGYCEAAKDAREQRRPDREQVEMHKEVTHTRRVLFLKPDYWVVVDTLSASDDAEHVYESLFHLDADEAVSDESLNVSTADPDRANLTIVPMTSEGLGVEIVKGKEDDPVQGWGNDPWRPVPTAIYTQKGSGTTWMAYALYPTRPGEAARIASVAPIGATDDTVGLIVAFENGASDTVLIGQIPGQEYTVGDYATDAEAVIVRTCSEGETVRLVSGTYVKREGERIS
jgi:hypothetical protein